MKTQYRVTGFACDALLNASVKEFVDTGFDLIVIDLFFLYPIISAVSNAFHAQRYQRDPGRVMRQLIDFLLGVNFWCL